MGGFGGLGGGDREPQLGRDQRPPTGQEHWRHQEVDWNRWNKKTKRRGCGQFLPKFLRTTK